MSKQIVSYARRLVDKLHGESPSPIMLGAWLAEWLEVDLEQIEEAKAEIIEILDLTNEHDEDREWALFLSVFIAVDQVEREIDSLLKTQEEKSDVESPKIC